MGAEDVAARDKADSKVTSFLSAADGVTTIDNSDMDFEHTLDVMIKLIEDAIENQEYEQLCRQSRRLRAGRRRRGSDFRPWL